MMADLENENDLLNDLNERFLNENKIMSSYGLPMPKVRYLEYSNYILYCNFINIYIYIY